MKNDEIKQIVNALNNINARNQSSYRSIMKATSVWGVQVFYIVIAIVRSKIIAVLLGPAGMGIVGLLNSTTDW
jgi:hypothetical protein